VVVNAVSSLRSTNSFLADSQQKETTLQYEGDTSPAESGLDTEIQSVGLV